MSADTSAGEDSFAVLLAKCLGVGGLLGVVGLVVFVAVTYLWGTLWAPIGLIPAVAAGYGVRRVAGDRAGVLTGLVAVVTGQGPVLVMYYALLDVLGGYSLGQADVAILLFGVLVAYKVGTGPDDAAGSVDEADLGDEPVAGDPTDALDDEAVAEVLEDEDGDLDDLADALAGEEASSADGTGAPGEAQRAEAGGGGETAADWVAGDGDDATDGGRDDVA